jgi:hypothetical protein
MRTDLATAMLSATRLTRARKLMEATRVIQSALLIGDREAAPELSEGLRLFDSVAVDGGQIIDVTPEVPDYVRPQRQPRVPADDYAKGLPLDLPRFNLDGLTTVRPRKTSYRGHSLAPPEIGPITSTYRRGPTPEDAVSFSCCMAVPRVQRILPPAPA